ncbi:MAG: carboxypeptidase-like regulatory domain-containing protein, partial [Holophagales bacterium]|nr:carboxypeptidase-like regulatory domain-containing protein [Holophagales bacterium]
MLLSTSSVLGQSGNGNLYGRVTDNEGQRLGFVTVTLTGGGVNQVQQTDETGDFRFLGLDPGNYRIEARLDGYSSIVHEAINIRLGRNTTIELELSAAIEETITV